MMEKLEVPQTFLALKAMIKEIDEDQDGIISFREVSDAMMRLTCLDGLVGMSVDW